MCDRSVPDTFFCIPGLRLNGGFITTLVGRGTPLPGSIAWTYSASTRVTRSAPKRDSSMPARRSLSSLPQTWAPASWPNTAIPPSPALGSTRMSPGPMFATHAARNA